MGMKEFLPERDFVGLRRLQYYVTQVRNFDTCVYISENECTSPLKTMYGTFFFFFEIYIKFPTPSIPLGGRYDIFHNRKEKIPLRSI